jgi:long-chain fatty acid transport protein
VARTPWLVVVGLALLPTTANAENLEEFGLGARSQGMGGAFTALASDSSAAYYNPGGLIFSRHLNLTFGYSHAASFLTFDSGNSRLDKDAEDVPTLGALTLGVSTTVPIDVPDRLGVGLTIFAPTGGILDMEAKSDSSAPEWFSYGKRHNRLLLLPAFGLKLIDGISLGIGLPMILNAIGETTIEGGLTAPVQTDLEIELRPGFGAIVGFLFTPKDWLSFGITYRSEIAMELEFPATAVLEGITLPIDLETTQFFSPHQVQFGAAVNFTDDLLVSLDFAWVNWSGYDRPFLEVKSSAAAVIQSVDVDFRDVFHFRLGAELVANDWLIVRGGYAFRTSAVPDQSDETTNLVDSNKHVFSIGAGFTFGQAPEELSDEAKASEGRAETMEEALVDASFDLDVFLQYHFHESVSADKPAGDPVGDWDADGGLFNVGFSLTARF